MLQKPACYFNFVLFYGVVNVEKEQRCHLVIGITFKFQSKMCNVISLTFLINLPLQFILYFKLIESYFPFLLRASLKVCGEINRSDKRITNSIVCQIEQKHKNRLLQ